MSKRQRFFVELAQDRVTMVSWKQLVADGERISTSEMAAPSTDFPAKTVVPGLNRATIPNNSNTTESNPLKSRGKLKLSLSNSAKTTSTKPAEQKPSLDDRTLIKYTSRVSRLATQIQPKSNEKRIVEAKLEFGHEHDSVAMKLAGPKGKVHRSMPGKTSCRTKKKTQACFCCSKRIPRPKHEQEFQTFLLLGASITHFLLEFELVLTVAVSKTEWHFEENPCNWRRHYIDCIRNSPSLLQFLDTDDKVACLLQHFVVGKQ